MQCQVEAAVPENGEQEVKPFGKRQFVGVEDCVGQDVEGSPAILAPEPTNTVGGEAESLDCSATAVPAFLYTHRVEQLNLAGIRNAWMLPVIIILIAFIDECLKCGGFRHIGPRSLPPGL